MAEINFKAKKVSVEPQNAYETLVIIDGFDTKEVLEQFSNEEVLNTFGTDEICKHFDHSELLDEIKIETIKEYLRDNGETEL